MDYSNLKRYLKLTWDEENEDLQDIVDRGKSYLNGKAGVELDFEKDHDAQQLLLDYGRYVYNHSFELFEHNFQGELFALSLREGVKDHADEEAHPEADS
ncbi:hypothetical protein [Evansella clarkii]|uniref:hypothetical protein n=1 Tax=Evansella clarkii TaxID=79879 RepID=UPI000B44E490|nr:hypothetical protein [Evansella clarkii]